MIPHLTPREEDYVRDSNGEVLFKRISQWPFIRPVLKSEMPREVIRARTKVRVLLEYDTSDPIFNGVIPYPQDPDRPYLEHFLQLLAANESSARLICLETNIQSGQNVYRWLPWNEPEDGNVFDGTD